MSARIYRARVTPVDVDFEYVGITSEAEFALDDEGAYLLIEETSGIVVSWAESESSDGDIHCWRRTQKGVFLLALEDDAEVSISCAALSATFCSSAGRIELFDVEISDFDPDDDPLAGGLDGGEMCTNRGAHHWSRRCGNVVQQGLVTRFACFR